MFRSTERYIALICLLIGTSCAQFPSIQEHCKVLDMTYKLVEDGFMMGQYDHFLDNNVKLRTLAKGEVEGTQRGEDPYYVYYGSFSMMEHIGTHVDSPLHVLASNKDARKPGMNTIDNVPLNQLIGEACVIDIPEAHRGNPDYQISIADVQEHEKVHGELHKGCMIIIRTGHGLFANDRVKYLGIDGIDVIRNERGHPINQHYPGIHRDAAAWILENRGLTAIGIDATSFDFGQNMDWHHSVHSIILGANKPGIENLANVDKLPNRGATIMALPLRLNGASGSPARVIAIGWDGEHDPCRISAGFRSKISSNLIIIAAFGLILSRFM